VEVSPLLPHLIRTKLPGKFTESAEIRGQNALFAVQSSPDIAIGVCVSRLSVEIGASLIFAARSSQKCSHLIHIDSPFALPAGVRLETAAEIDKRKTEIYFSSHKKKFD
jgi:hypothetical protein